MNELPKNLLNYIQGGEGTEVEFKTARNKLPVSLFESICGMLNRNGGHVFLGVSDNGEIIGVCEKSIRQMRRDFVNQCNDPGKICPTVRLEMKEFMFNNKTILYVHIYESSDVHKTAHKIYDRNEDGDFDITNNTSLVAQLYIRKDNTYIENQIYPYARISDLRSDLFERVRRMASNKTANHPWEKMSDKEMLMSAGLYGKNLQTGEEGINLAGILLLGKDETIASALSYYKTDALLLVENVERYDDRDDIKTNLIESYDRLVAFIGKHLNDKFYLEDGQRINVRDIIAREVCVNMLIHREFSNPHPARLMITKDALITENANKPRTTGYIDLNNYSPYPKNPKIADFFKEIGLADELGSGIRNIRKYNKIYSGGVPIFRDDTVFRVEIPLSEKNDDNTTYSERDINEILKVEILDYIVGHNGVTRQEINSHLTPMLEKYKIVDFDEKVKYLLRMLRLKNEIKNIGSRKKSVWVSED